MTAWAIAAVFAAGDRCGSSLTCAGVQVADFAGTAVLVAGARANACAVLADLVATFGVAAALNVRVNFAVAVAVTCVPSFTAHASCGVTRIVALSVHADVSGSTVSATLALDRLTETCSALLAVCALRRVGAC